MDPLSVTASIIAVIQLSAKVLAYISDARDAPKERSQCEAEISNLSTLLRNLRDHVQTGDLSQPWYTAIAELAAPKGPLDQFKQALEALQNKITDGGRLKRVGEALVWKFKKEEVASILGQIERIKTRVGIAFEMDHFKLSQDIKDDTNLVRTHVPTIHSGVDKIQADQANVRYSKMLEWISPTNFPAQQSDILGRRQKGTGQWFLSAPEFASWLCEPKGMLFCPGIPGAGKTMVAAIAIDHLLKSVQSSSVGVAYVYCNYKVQDEQDASSMLAAIVKQLVQGRSLMAEPVERLHKQHADRGTKPSLEEIFGALQEVVAKYSTVYVAIDALDECRNSDGTRSQFLARLKDLQVKQDVRFLTTSRLIPEIEAEFQTAIKLEIRASDEDVRRYVADQMQRLPMCIQRDRALQATIQDKIVEAVDGMFLLARLHTESLLDKRKVKQVKLALGQFSKGSAALNQAYDKAIQRIDGQLDGDKELAKTVLSWITYARRPLTTTELCCALAVESDDTELDPENMPDVEDLLSVCAGLIVIDQESAIIRLVHYTTQEYFERNENNWFSGFPLQIASTCVTYLSFDLFKAGGCSTDEEFEERLEENKFLDYAAKYWGEHVMKVESNACALACSFLSNNCLVSNAAQVLFASIYPYRDYSQEYFEYGTGAHLAARFGLSLVLANMLLPQGQERKAEITTKDSYGQTLLYIAAANGHRSTVELLVDMGADANAQNAEYGNALYAASSKGYEAIVKLLLDNGADVNAQNRKYDNALYAASSKGYEAIVKLLLDNGANINAQNGENNNALYMASSKGYEAIVKLLLDKGADVNAQGVYDSNALCVASYEGHEAIVKLLLDKGADVNADDALQTASYEGHEAIVKLLLDKGADVNAQGGYHGNALQAALYKGHEAIVKLLLDKGASVDSNAFQVASYRGHEAIVKLLLDKGDVNAQGGYYGNTLQAASCGGHEAIVKLLLNNGADVNAQGGEYGNALSAASYRGHEAIMKLLLDKGAKVNNMQDIEYSNGLYLASYRGHEAIVKLLLDKGADVNAQNIKYGNALYAASYRGYEAIVKQLLDKGADVNAQSIEHSNALFAASYRGHEAIVKLLLDKGAEVNAQGGYFGNALQVASERGYEAIVKLLLDKGADVNAQSGYCGNALYVASCGGHEAIVKLLLDNGTDVNAQGGEYGNALSAASYRGYEAIMKLLLDNGADVNAQGGFFGNALQVASYGGYEAIVKLLINKGANVNAQGGRYGNALQATSYGGYEAIVRLLLDKGANINAQGGYYGNALQGASCGGHEAIVKLLLNKGANVNAQGGRYGNALQATSYGGYEAIVRLLLDKGANINAQGGYYGNALQGASCGGHEAIVKLLLNKGANVNAQGGRYGNALQAASGRGYKAIVKLLLDKDASVNS